ncbi:hypothetical protein KSP40_PGU022326 [Platanthera guangdongensis]|uniref:Uncharacterized protein n=1 Tax=Platanthera guangdongensis TaxID=2320717 RepID=A0ABR2N525_9ASPA
MAEEIPESTPTFEEGKTHVQGDMDVEDASVDEPISAESTGDHPAGADKPSDNGGVKRGREEEEKDGEYGGAAKKPNIERSVEEERLEELEGEEVCGEDEVEKEVIEDDKVEETEPAAGNVGPKIFSSSVEMFNYFYKLIHDWPTNLDVNKMCSQYFALLCTKYQLLYSGGSILHGLPTFLGSPLIYFSFRWRLGAPICRSADL